jgi:hypothetical protein
MERGNICSDVKAKIASGEPVRMKEPKQSIGAE